ncbi:MAG TPA: cytochrome b/b6 domain-containing protein [Magnetospirillaceae bacterium]|nr:cytochrome b/b6 domain-containing protein [Magnetospirillaceae bacterium]
MTGARIWDLPTRLFHWMLVLLVLVAWQSAERRDISLHVLTGSGLAGLLVFRVWWGFFGSSTARFGNFLKGPGAIIAYARSLLTHSEPELGHNPMGGWSVAALLICLLGLIGFGLFAVDTDGLDSGPFADYVDFDTGRIASHLHARFFDGLEVLVALHLCAILFYHLIKRHKLVHAMVTGRQPHLTEDEVFIPGTRPALAIGVALGMAVALALARLGGAF